MKTQFSCSLLVVIGLLLFCLPSFAQIATVTDNTCTAGQECAGQNGHGCNTTTFTVTSNGTYTLTASIDECNGTACSLCLSEAYIYGTASQPVACTYNECSGSCSPRSTTCALSTGITYTLYSCKIDCTGEDCTDCSTSCTARATVTR